MHKVSRRGLFSLICGLGGAAIACSKLSLLGTAMAGSRAIPPMEPPTRLDESHGSTSSEAVEVGEAIGRFEWFDGRWGYLREEGGDRRILVLASCLRAARIEKVSTDTIYRCAFLRRPKGLLGFRIWEVSTPS